MTCERCTTEFVTETFRGYCSDCIGFFTTTREKVHRCQRPGPGIFADGQFADPNDVPRSVFNHDTNKETCGLCGGTDLEPGYGIGSGYGMGSYTFCEECGAFLNFSEDRE